MEAVDDVLEIEDLDGLVRVLDSVKGDITVESLVIVHPLEPRGFPGLDSMPGLPLLTFEELVMVGELVSRRSVISLVEVFEL